MIVKNKERGVALLFALGLLSMLLILGLAFVGNAIVAQKVAVNNSSRTQARMLAVSAVNRAAASIMLYQHQIWKADSVAAFPENFASIFSYGTVKTSDANDKVYTDGLLKKSNSASIFLLPEDDTVVAKTLANQFNIPFKDGSWLGSWVYFYNTSDTNDDDRRIIGRAAWQVMSSSPQILAPVFFRGHIDSNNSQSGFIPNKHRWGREIDEAYLDNTAILRNVPGNYAGGIIESFDVMFGNGALNVTSDAHKRWVERWLVPDPEGQGAYKATMTTPEVYQYKESAKRPAFDFMRFNISDLYHFDNESGNEINSIAKYGVSTSSDPWYARFQVDSTGSATDCNSLKAIENLTKASQIHNPGDDFDYNISFSNGERGGIPFLRRIGRDSEKGSFTDLAALRKQIAANFNDYCDEDSVPTSNVASDKWLDNIDAAYAEPEFTGNERTPYLYELGFQMGIHASENAADLLQSGINPAITDNGDGTSKITFSSFLRLVPMVKLANIYQFDPAAASSCQNIKAFVDPGEVTVEMKLQKATLKNVTVKYWYMQDGSRVDSEFVTDVVMSDIQNNVSLSAGVLPLKNTTLSINVAEGGFNGGTEGLTFDDAKVKNSGGVSNPYPFRYFKQDGTVNDPVAQMFTKSVQLKTLNSSGAEAALNIQVDSGMINSSFVNNIPSNFDAANVTSISQPTGVAVDTVSVERIALKPRRAVLTADLNKVPGSGTATEIGIDYVKKFENAVEWKKDANAGDVIYLTVNNSTSSDRMNGILLGGIRNYDPRQNLNNGDWAPNNTTDGFKILKHKAVNYVNPTVDELANVMCVEASGAEIVGIKNGTSADFQPDGKSNADRETVTEVAWKDDANHLSTAYIRNAPMMSPWEIGLVHRGIKWQTLNIKSACDPDDNSAFLTYSSHKPHGGSWNLAGTTYNGGDGGILDQIKMTEQIATYGKINLNMLRSNHPDFNSALDLDMAKALFDNVKVGQDIQTFYNNSTRTADKFPNTADTGSSVDAATLFNQLKNGSEAHDSRGAFLSWVRNSAYGDFCAGTNDARQEELIGKTINLTTASPSTPTQIQVVVVAQTIRDVAGMQFRATSCAAGDFDDATVEDKMAQKECKFGEFDAAIHNDDDGKNVYFDEITGEVKMFVTIERDPVTGRLSIRRVDYLE